MWQEKAASSEVFILQVFADKPCRMFKIDIEELDDFDEDYIKLDERDNILIPMEKEEETTFADVSISKTELQKKMTQKYGVDINMKISQARRKLDLSMN